MKQHMNNVEHVSWKAQITPVLKHVFVVVSAAIAVAMFVHAGWTDIPGGVAGFLTVLTLYTLSV